MGAREGSTVVAGIEIASVDNRFEGARGRDEAGETFSFQRGTEIIGEIGGETREVESDGAADDDGGGGIFANKIGEAEGEAIGDGVERGGIAEFGDVGAKKATKSGGGGEVFPFFLAGIPGIEMMARLEAGRGGGDGAVEGEAGADAGREGQVEGKTAVGGGLVESGEIGVVEDENGAGE